MVDSIRTEGMLVTIVRNYIFFIFDFPTTSTTLKTRLDRKYNPTQATGVRNTTISMIFLSTRLRKTNKMRLNSNMRIELANQAVVFLFK